MQAIAGLVTGRVYGWMWIDPIIGIVGGLVIARWSWGLMKDACGFRAPEPPAHYKERLRGLPGLSHVTVEVNASSATRHHAA